MRITYELVSDATVYRVFRCLDNGLTCGSPIGFTSTGRFDDRKVVPGTVYYYRVRPCIKNPCGKFSTANTGFASIPPPTPTGVRASDGSYPYHVHISWNPVEGGSVYRVFSCLDKGQTCGGPLGFPKGTSFEDKTGAAGTVYYYRVRACIKNACGKFSVANAGHRSGMPAFIKDDTQAFPLPGQQVPIPTLNFWGRLLAMLIMLSAGLIMTYRRHNCAGRNVHQIRLKVVDKPILRKYKHVDDIQRAGTDCDKS